MKKLSFKQRGVVWATTSVTALNMLGVTPLLAHDWDHRDHREPAVTLATSTGTVGANEARQSRSDEEHMRLEEKIELLRKRVRYVFVLFQENRSFDHYFGTYPGANGLFATFPGADPENPYSQPATEFSSFRSVIQDTTGSFTSISPFFDSAHHSEQRQSDRAAVP